MRRGYDPHRRQQGRPTVPLTSLPAPKAQPPGAGTGVNSPAGAKVAASTPQTNGIGSNGFGVRSPPLEKVGANRGARLPRKPAMSIMVRHWPPGASNTCSNGDLHLAAGEGDAEKVGEHLRSNGDVDVRDGRQWSLLHHASFHGRLTVVGVLLDAGADKEACTAIQMTPLCLACQNGHQEVAEELLRRGASVAGVDVAGSDASTGCGTAESGNGDGDGSMVAHVRPTALFIAAREGHLSLVELLLDRRGRSVSILRGPNGKFAGDEFGKGVDEEARSRIRAILADARKIARKEAAMLRDRRQENDARDAESQIGGTGHHPPLEIHNSQVCTSRLPCYDAATPVPVRNGHRPDPVPVPVPFPSNDSAPPAPAPLSEMSMSQPEEVCGTGMPSSLSNHHRTVSTRRSYSFGQGAADETESLLSGDSRNDHHVLGNSAGGRRLGEGSSRIQDSWTGANSDTGSRGIENGNGVRLDIAMPKPGQQPNAPRDLGSILNGATEPCMDGRGPHSRVANGHATASGIATIPSSSSIFKLAIEQPLSAKVAPGPASSNTPGRTPSRVGGDEGDMSVKSRPSLALSSPGLPTPQEWQRCVRPNGPEAPPSSAPPPGCHEDKEQTPPRQMQDLSSNPGGGGSRTGTAAGSMSTPTAPRGMGAEPAILSPVEEVMDGDALADPTQDVTSMRSRSAAGEGSKIEFGGASPCDQWLKHPMPPRSATAPPPTSRSPAHVPLSPAGTVGGSVVVGKGDSSEFEDTWRMTFANLMDLRTLYRINSRSANGRSAAWMGWEEEKRALEETISELNMRLASKDHDIAELHMQLEERERDLRLMHGRDLDRLGISDLSELEQRVQAALALIQGKRERVVYKLLKEGGDGAGRDSQRPDTVARS